MKKSLLGFDRNTKARQKNTPITKIKYNSGMNKDQFMYSTVISPESGRSDYSLTMRLSCLQIRNPKCEARNKFEIRMFKCSKHY